MSVFNQSEFDNHELVVFKQDQKTGLRAIIALHNTQLGPGVGGCRMYPYVNDEQALIDVLRLSKGMSYKSALAGLPLGGAKAVIIGDPHSQKTPELLLAMGSFINSLAGAYIGAEDSGTNVADMKIISQRTAHVSGVDADAPHAGDPSPSTALGVFVGIQAALRFKLQRASVKGLSVAVQGAGAVGYHLIQLLIEAGAKVFVADINANNLKRAADMGAIVVDGADVMALAVDVLAPCAMGAVLNDTSVEVVRAPIIAGAANNQLALPEHGCRLAQRNILYVPDYAINAGGIIDVHYQRRDEGAVLTAAKVSEHVNKIADTLELIFSRAQTQGLPTHEVADNWAKQLLATAVSAEQVA